MQRLFKTIVLKLFCLKLHPAASQLSETVSAYRKNNNREDTYLLNKNHSRFLLKNAINNFKIVVEL